MLSKIIKSEKIDKDKIKSITVPHPEQLKAIIHKRQMAFDRKNLLDSNQNNMQSTARKEAEKILSEAQNKLKTAELDIIKKKQEVEESTRQELEKKLNAQISQEISQIKQEFTKTLKTLGNLKTNIFEESESQLIELVFSICRKIIGEEIKTSKEAILGLLRKGFLKVRNAKVQKIILNPVDFEILVENQESLLNDVQNSDEIRFEKDPGIERGGCVIKTLQGEMTTEPLKQLEVIKEEFSQNA